jgi:long-chain acyl-CoA synthetase
VNPQNRQNKGVLDEHGCPLEITGRTKEIFKMSKGKFVSPFPIKNKLSANHLVEDLACIGGKAQPQPFSILQLSEGHKNEASKGEEQREEIGKEVEAHMKTVNPTLDGQEHLQFLGVVRDEAVASRKWFLDSNSKDQKCLY